MATIRHHPKHLRILVLAQTNGASGVIVPRRQISLSAKLKPRIRVYHVLVQPHRHVGLALVIIVRHKHNTRQNDAFGSSRSRSGGVVGAVAVVAAAEVGGEEKGGEEEEKGKGYGDGVAKAKVGNGE